MQILQPDHLDELFARLRDRGYAVLGPTRRDDAIVYDELESAASLPAGWTERQEAGSYRLERRDDGAFFGYAVGPHSWKRYLHPPVVSLWRAERGGEGPFRTLHLATPERRLALVGVRPCELAAIAIQDRVLLGGEHVDPVYRARRERVFLVAVNCGAPAGTCFCGSMGTGPGATQGFDLLLTELLGEGRHRFTIEAGSRAGEEVLAELDLEAADEAERQAASRVLAAAADRMGRSLDTNGIQEALYAAYEHPRWDEVASRCLACTNCTMVCPTCFCTTVDETTDLAGGLAERRRRWDSCFTDEFSYIHGGSVRSSIRSRYRQWLIHKLAAWHDQFGSSGCVGCGRCITWCPAAIDITEEAAALRSAATTVASGA